MIDGNHRFLLKDNIVTHNRAAIVGSDITSVGADMLHAKCLYLSAGALPTSRRIAFWTQSTPSLSNTLPAWVGCYALGDSRFPYGFSKPKNLNFQYD